MGSNKIHKLITLYDLCHSATPTSNYSSISWISASLNTSGS